MNRPEPIAFVKSVKKLLYGGYSIRVDCPFCGKEHSHGDTYVKGKYDFGTRGSHCFKKPSYEYRIIMKQNNRDAEDVL